jgi:Tfp pilus assembly protein PilO
MNSFSKAKRLQALLILAGTVVIMTLLYTHFIRPGQLRHYEVEQQQAAGRSEQEAARNRIRLAAVFEQDLLHAEERLGLFEATMASGDVYLWMIRALDRISDRHRVHFNQIEPPQFEPNEFVPRVPYEAARFTVSGSATYADFGHFLADLENTYPFLRFRHLELEPMAFGRPNPEEANQLRFQGDFSVLVRKREK